MSQAALAIVRLLLSAWVGGAALFVMTSVAEQRSTDFTSVMRDQLATIRFPLYYLFALLTLVPGTLFLVLMLLVPRVRRVRVVVLAAVLAVASCGTAAWDYFQVYRPLQQLIEPPGKARTQEFILLHERSRLINEVHVSLALLAALLTCCGRLPDSPKPG